MGKISKRSAAAVSGLGSVCLILGVCISVISWVLTRRTPTVISYSDGRFGELTTYIHAYWWGGLSVSIYFCCNIPLKSCFSVFLEFLKLFFCLHKIISVIKTNHKLLWTKCL